MKKYKAINKKIIEHYDQYIADLLEEGLKDMKEGRCIDMETVLKELKEKYDL